MRYHIGETRYDPTHQFPIVERFGMPTYFWDTPATPMNLGVRFYNPFWARCSQVDEKGRWYERCPDNGLGKTYYDPTHQFPVEMSSLGPIYYT